MYILRNQIQHYAWGSRTAIAELLGRSAAPEPEAEMWMGAHPNAPSMAVTPKGEMSLRDVISTDPLGVLGERTVAVFGTELPFLLKVLAADKPLSLQAHPSREQARAGFDAEEVAQVPRTAAHRNYKDPNHKPELLCALTEFDALCGFRRPEDIRALVAWLDVPALRDVMAPLEKGEEGLRSAFQNVARTTQKAALVDDTIAACRARTNESAFQNVARLALSLNEEYPGDVGVIHALMLNIVKLQPFEAIYLPHGNMHAYLRGVGIEIMANSDNVLRGGLTPKHVDVPELLRVLEWRAWTGAPIRGEPSKDAREFVYRTTAPDFQLSRIQVQKPYRGEVAGPEILLVTEGAITITRNGDALRLGRGESAFVEASLGSYELSGEGQLFRARVGQ